MKVSLVVATYNWKEALHLCLLSAFQQTRIPDEIIIADDGSRADTRQLIETLKSISPVKLIHSWQADEGFQLAQSRNKAIMQAQHEYIISIDGDLILHPEFIADHCFHAKKQQCIQGGRVLLSAAKSQAVLTQQQIQFSAFESGLKNRKNAIYSRFLAQRLVRQVQHERGVRGCNMSFYRHDFLQVNGFNESFSGWGREDSEFIVRLLNNGVKRCDVRFNCIVYHLYHTEKKCHLLSKNDILLADSINKKRRWCDNGCDKYHTSGHLKGA